MAKHYTRYADYGDLEVRVWMVVGLLASGLCDVAGHRPVPIVASQD